MYLGAGPYPASDVVTRTLFGAKAGGPAGHAKAERMVKFQGNWYYGEDIRDFIFVMRGISNWHKATNTSSWFKRWWSKDKEGRKDIGLEQPQVVSLYKAEELEQLNSAANQASLLMDSLLTESSSTSKNDAFSSLKAYDQGYRWG